MAYPLEIIYGYASIPGDLFDAPRCFDLARWAALLPPLLADGRLGEGGDAAERRSEAGGVGGF